MLASIEGTKRYALKYSKHKDAYSIAENLAISSLGIGSYMPEPYWEEAYKVSYEEAIYAAIANGINHIDTAINYRFRQSEKEIGKAIKKAIANGVVKRDELFVASKAGFLPLDYPFPQNPYEWIDDEIIKKELAEKEDIIADQHCLTPKFLTQSLEWSLENLGLESIDCFYLHNPEIQLGYIDYKTLLKRIEAAFELFESLCAAHKIGFYGIASWNAFLWEEDHAEYIRLNDLVKIAQKIGGENHRFRFIQSPFNLAKPHAYNYTNQPLDDGLYYTLFQAAERLKINAIASSSLLRMALFKRPFSPKAAALLGGGFSNATQYALQFARSAIGVKSALFSSTNAAHVLENLLVLEAERCAAKSYNALFNLQGG
ncbi:MAG: aldo/keto reductase [Helicobacteraceae bacterium]|jgi:aryl-alcohol dehydrogenase-like predicted oxidoreductase|nr:aldo/keto reductase [Helicobacteraceae bacterium]